MQHKVVVGGCSMFHVCSVFHAQMYLSVAWSIRMVNTYGQHTDGTLVNVALLPNITTPFTTVCCLLAFFLCVYAYVHTV